MDIDNLRLARAIHLDCERTGYGVTYFVSGGRRSHLVNLDAPTPSGVECDCEDHQLGTVYCKHTLRALLAEGNADVLKRLRWFIPVPSARQVKRQSVAA